MRYRFLASGSWMCPRCTEESADYWRDYDARDAYYDMMLSHQNEPGLPEDDDLPY